MNIHSKHPELVNVPDNNGITPLMYVCQDNPDRYMKFFINELNADISLVDKLGDSVLMYACRLDSSWGDPIQVFNDSKRNTKFLFEKCPELFMRNGGDV